MALGAHKEDSVTDIRYIRPWWYVLLVHGHMTLRAVRQ
jgi:hypothetical protein